MMHKALLRQTFLKNRQQLEESTYWRYNEQIEEAFFRHFDLSRYSYLHTYLACHNRKEVDTWLIIQQIWQQHPHLVVAVPKMNHDQIASYALTPKSLLERNRWGIQEPVTGAVLTPSLFQLCIVPLLAFDQQGNRVGYGKGHYDRFLAACPPTMVKVGCCFFPPVARIDDMATHDVRLDYCITPQRVWRF